MLPVNVPLAPDISPLKLPALASIFPAEVILNPALPKE